MKEWIDVKELTMEEIKKLPNMLGKIAPAMCNAHGEYKCVIGGVKTHIILKEV